MDVAERYEARRIELKVKIKRARLLPTRRHLPRARRRKFRHRNCFDAILPAHDDVDDFDDVANPLADAGGHGASRRCRGLRRTPTRKRTRGRTLGQTR